MPNKYSSLPQIKGTDSKPHGGYYRLLTVLNLHTFMMGFSSIHLSTDEVQFIN